MLTSEKAVEIIKSGVELSQNRKGKKLRHHNKRLKSGIGPNKTNVSP